MLERFVYENHLGQRFAGLENGVYLNYNDLRDYSWSYESINSRISRFYRAVRNRKLPLVVACNSEAEALLVKNRLHEYAEKDIAARMPGKVYVGDYYTQGYITASTKSNYLINDRYCHIDLTLTSDNPAWYREQKHVFIPGTNTESDISGGVDYPFDYPFDYALSMVGRRITCDAIGSSAFKLVIYGEVENPAILIGSHLYAVTGRLKAGETLLIDGVNKTITLTTAQGVQVNWFDKRVRESYVFEPIPTGQSIVSWSGTYGFDLIIVEERSEPRWT